MPPLFRSLIRLAAFGLICLSLVACAGKRPAADDPDSMVCMDLVTLPQDLLPYAKQSGTERLLISPERQAGLAARTETLFFRPWSVTAPNAALGRSLKAHFGLGPGKRFAENLRPVTPDQWAALERNADAGTYPRRAGQAIVVTPTSMRAMPTERPLFRNPDHSGEGYPFDYFQHTALWVGTPVFLSHVSLDGEWVLAETAWGSGWIPARDAAVVDEAFKRLWRSRPLAAVLKDNLHLRADAPRERGDRVTGRAASARAHIGALLPLAENNGSPDLLFPTRGPDGLARALRARVAQEDVHRLPLALTPGNIARVGNEMMGQPYGWGGLLENRDCSAMTRDLFIPFGLLLPRNSTNQSKYGDPLDLKGLTPDAKEAAIASRGEPFFSLIWMPGHIGLYLGSWEGKPVMFHNVWGLRVKEAFPGKGRAVIGKAVVTTLRPGAERPDISTPASLLDRVEKIAVLPGPEPDSAVPPSNN